MSHSCLYVFLIMAPQKSTEEEILNGENNNCRTRLNPEDGSRATLTVAEREMEYVLHFRSVV